MKLILLIPVRCFSIKDVWGIMYLHNLFLCAIISQSFLVFIFFKMMKTRLLYSMGGYMVWSIELFSWEKIINFLKISRTWRWRNLIKWFTILLPPLFFPILFAFNCFVFPLIFAALIWKKKKNQLNWIHLYYPILQKVYVCVGYLTITN